MKKIKRKGGAEKLRDKKKKKLEDEAKECKSISQMFFQAVQAEETRSDKDNHLQEAMIQTKTENNEEILIDTADAEKIPDVPNDKNEETEAVIEPKADTYVEVEDQKKYFKKPDKDINLTMFFKIHPKQPMEQIPFNPFKAYFRKAQDNESEQIKRQWLTYSNEYCKLFCSFCLAFSQENNRFTFGCGTTKIENPYERIREHEQSLIHHRSAEAYMLWSQKLEVISLLQHKRNEDIKKRRLILERIIDTIKLIGKRGLSCRGAKDAEAAYTLKNSNLDHGNFLEIILLLAKYDPFLQKHVDECVASSSKLNKDNSGPGRPGSFVTFLSKTTINYIIESISKLMKACIAQEVKNAGMFSIQIDSTQDINVHDQLCVILRYVTDKVNERVIAVEHCKSGTGKNLADLVSHLLDENGIDIKKCIGSSTDGAANMRGQYNGFSAWLTTTIPEQNHVWCYAHVLNLVMSDATTVCTEAVNLFGVMNSCANFVKDSYLRMAVWEEKSKFKFINSIGETRWWAKDKCLSKIFGPYAMPENALFIDLLETLQEISTSTKFNPDVRYKASTLFEKFQTFEILITAHIFLRIFSCTTPLSQYLQTKGLNLITAYQMVQKTLKSLKEQSRDFDTILEKSKRFVAWANNKFNENDSEISVNNNFVEKRISRKKKMSGEKSTDEPIINAVDQYRINVYNIIYDCIIGSIESRFVGNEQLFNDIVWLDPNSFKDIEKIPNMTFKFLSTKIKKYNTNLDIDAHSIQNELKDFASK